MINFVTTGFRESAQRSEDPLNYRPDHVARIGIKFVALVIATVAGVILVRAAAAQEIDARSYHLGSISSWSEAVGAGIKELALSSPADPAAMDDIEAAAQELATEHANSVAC